jgi:hypothetical protein
MVKSINKKMANMKLKIEQSSFLKNDRAYASGFIMIPVMMILGVVIAASLGASTVPQAITTASDTTNITGYNSWSQSAKTSFGSVSNFIALDYQLVFVIILLVAIAAIMGGM